MRLYHSMLLLLTTQGARSISVCPPPSTITKYVTVTADRIQTYILSPASSSLRPLSKTITTIPAGTFNTAKVISKKPIEPLMTIAITNRYGRPLSLSLLANSEAPPPIGNPLPTVLPSASKTQYTFPTGWAGRISVGPNLHSQGSKIEGSFTNEPDIDVSYVDGYTVPITCLSQGIPVTGCNVELFNQPNLRCPKMDGRSVCLNPARDFPNGPTPPFFKACEAAAYTYPNDNLANLGGLKSTFVSCCIGTRCEAPSRQPGVNY